MTSFLFSTFNHCPVGQVAVADIINIMAAQLEALGYEVGTTTGTPFIRKGFNLVLENFVLPEYTQAVAEAHARGCRFVFVATEEPTMVGFNSGLDPGMIERQRRFPEAARYASAILHLIPGDQVRAYYSQFAPCAFADLGYAPKLANNIWTVEPKYDFGFFGQQTWRRDQAFDLCRARGSDVVVVYGLRTSCADRDELMRQCRVVLQVRANHEMGWVSSSRCAVSLHLGRPVIAEPHPNCKGWDQVVDFSATDEAFYDDAMRMARDWRAAYARQFAKFTEIMTPERCIGAPLRQVGIIPC